MRQTISLVGNRREMALTQPVADKRIVRDGNFCHIQKTYEDCKCNVASSNFSFRTI